MMLAYFLLPVLLLFQTDPFLAQRDRMVRDHIEARGIRNRDVLAAMRSTPRHQFVPDEWRADAYADRPLPIGFRQTISQPYVVALMTELLEPRKELRVLEIGTGSGYQAAVLAALVKHVYTIEIVPELARMVSERLRSMGYRNITARQGDGYEGWREQAPFDRVILTAAPPEIPRALLDQLKPGGKLVAPVGDSPMNQELVVVDKGLDGRVHRRSVIPVAFVPMVKPRNR
jgi:protein-L-isoaspartate(D-aspartate) O-methyltransferase